MPGTIPQITDPILISTSTASSSVAAPSAQYADSPSASTKPTAALIAPLEGEQSKATLTPIPAVAPAPGDSLVSLPPAAGPGSAALPPAHPAAGVASLGAASLVAASSATAALAPSNSPAQMTSDMSKGSAAKSAAEAPPPVPAKGKGQAKAAAAKSEQKKNKDELVQFIERDGHFSLVRNFHLADAFTLMNGFCGAQSLFHSGRYLLTSDPRHAWFALWFPLFGAIFDLLDGKVARWRRSSSMLGQELDSLADSLSFGAAPAFAAFALGLRLPFDTLCLTVFVCAGIARLARFNVTTAAIPHDASGKAKYFEGLPIPSSLVLVGGMAICLLLGRVEAGALAIPHAPPTPSAFNPADGSYRFYGALAKHFPRAAAAAGSSVVPFGTFRLDATRYAARALAATHVLSPKTVIAWSSAAAVEGHYISALWFAWAMAMVSKTLHVPKP